MYVALRETFDVAADGRATRVMPGQEVTTFLSWPTRNQMAALSARIVREVPDGTPMTPQEVFARQPRAEIDEAKRGAMAAAAPSAAEAAADVALEQVSVAQVAEAVAAPPAPSRWTCGSSGCTFTSPSERGLRIHQATHTKKQS